MMTPELVDANNLLNHDILAALALGPDKVSNLLEQTDNIQSTVDTVT